MKPKNHKPRLPWKPYLPEKETLPNQPITREDALANCGMRGNLNDHIIAIIIFSLFF